MKKFFSELLNKAEDSFLKNHKCICCFKEIPDETPFMICENCLKGTEVLGGNLCKKCGDRLNAAGGCINLCDRNKYAFSSNTSLFYYTGTPARIIKNLKYGGKRYIANYVVALMLVRKELFENVDVILYVPSSKNRVRERGFNQAKVIAELLGEKLGLKVLDLLVKTKETIHQAGGTQRQRFENLKSSFGIKDIFANEVFGKNVLLVDDVFTTGSTLNECAKVVKKLKPKNIKTLTFAKTKFKLSEEEADVFETVEI